MSRMLARLLERQVMAGGEGLGIGDLIDVEGAGDGPGLRSSGIGSAEDAALEGEEGPARDSKATPHARGVGPVMREVISSEMGRGSIMGLSPRQLVAKDQQETAAALAPG